MSEVAGTLSDAPLAIDVISDVVCPWCFIGKRKLERALARFSHLTIEVRWRPFQLDSTIPATGVDRQVYLERKFGQARIAEIQQRIAEAGAEVGIAFAFNRIARSPNTLDAHRVIRWSHSVGAQSAMKERLFQLYFLEGADIGSRVVLVKASEEIGLDPKVVADLLENEADVGAVREEITTAARLGVSGVPFFIFDGKFAVPGAQSPDVLAAAIAKAREGGPGTMTA